MDHVGSQWTVAMTQKAPWSVSAARAIPKRFFSVKHHWEALPKQRQLQCGIAEWHLEIAYTQGRWAKKGNHGPKSTNERKNAKNATRIIMNVHNVSDTTTVQEI